MIRPATLSKYWHTVRYLRPVQVTARVRHLLLKPKWPDPRDHASPKLRQPAHPFVEPALRSPSMTGPAAFLFLNEPGNITTASDWNNSAHTKLWLYNLHYFDDLNASGAADRREWHHTLMRRWMSENPLGHGNGWEPYPLSLRIVNWIKWALAGNTLSDGALTSLSLQSAALAAQIEWHLLGNHILANAKALTFAGCFFAGDDAHAWLQQGLAIYEQELPEQILADGGHFELSPMYHAIIEEDILDLLNLSRVFPGLLPRHLCLQLEDIAARMRSWLKSMCHPDGGISFFNDAAFGIAPSNSGLEAYAERLGFAPLREARQVITHLAPSGYVRCQKGESVLLCDCAAVGPDYLPGHAHADTLSFEFSHKGERIIVNTGTSVYGSDAERLRQRGTAAHSTVVIGGADSSHVWGGFRVAQRARILQTDVAETASEARVSASHDGYTRLPGGNIHTRSWNLSDCSLVIDDQVTGPCAKATARFHLAPGTTVTIDQTGTSGHLTTPAGRQLEWRSITPVTISPSSWHPEFGLSLPTQCLDAAILGGTTRINFTWAD